MNALQAIVPKPVRVEPRDGVFQIKSDTIIAADEAAGDRAQQLASLLEPALGRRLRIATPTPQENCIALSIDPAAAPLGDEGYRITVSPRRAEIASGRSRGVFWGIQTLRQLLPVEIFSKQKVDRAAWEIPACLIEDSPRFTWRGLHLDCCRHFMPFEFLFKYVDLLSLHRMNTFHWHLTEDQGWRIEIKKYPKLTEVGAWRKETVVGYRNPPPPKFDGIRHGGFYTQDQARQLVKYAAERNVTIVPEIEMPGHSQAAIAAYPELGNHPDEPVEVRTTWGVSPHVLNVEESTIQFYRDVLTEVMELFPSQFIHVGGDEAPTDQWKTNPRMQERMRELKLTDERQLQSYFIHQIDEFLTKSGRRLIGWDEILEGGLAPGATVMSWRGEKGGIAAAKAEHDVVMTPSEQTYFDYYQSQDRSKEPLAIGGFTNLREVYGYEPVPKELTAEQGRHVLGSQGQIWTEFIPDHRQVEYMAYPRGCALSEVVWSPAGPRDFGEFLARLDVHLQRLKLLDVNYRPVDETAATPSSRPAGAE